MFRIFFAIIWRVALLGLGGWSVLVLQFSPILPVEWRLPLAIVLGIILFAALFWRRIFLIPLIIAIIAVCIGWGQLRPTNDLDWQTDLSKLAWAEVQGDDVTIYNVRDFKYRTETDYDVNYITKKVRLSDLSSLDLFTSYWAGKNIAHVFISFGFADRDYIAFSVEVRKTKSQSYSTVEGFFRNFQLIYIVAEERDLVGLRTKYRQPNERVHLLRTKYYKENGIKLFLQYLSNLNALVEKPQFYNTLTTNCTTQVLSNIHQVGPRSRFKYDWRLLLTGYAPEYFYNMGRLDDSFSLEGIMEKGLVNPRAQDVSEAEQFSKNIREGVPRPELFSSPPQ